MLPTLGFIGTGVMGASMAGHLLSAGYPLLVHNRTRSRAEALIAAGAHWCASPGELAAASEAVFSIVGYPEDVREIYLGAGGIVECVREGALLVDLTTSCPGLAIEIGEAGAVRGVDVIDAPVSGGDRGAREATLSIMVGGTDEAFARARGFLEVMGRTVVHQGPSGAGQHAKMCNQIAIASSMLGVCEALRYAQASGLDPGGVLRSIESGAAGSWSLSNLAPRILAEDYAPGFSIRHFVKDLGIALGWAVEMGLELPGLALARRLYEELVHEGCGDKGTQALMEWYRNDTKGTRMPG